ncbi:hypothetical protein N0V90_005431 [Kalmusia sp. IMI 367209]|nr:hypothetical protein N0V90_005431 [Kalmusia sp. IMI 367209]
MLFHRLALVVATFSAGCLAQQHYKEDELDKQVHASARDQLEYEEDKFDEQVYNAGGDAYEDYEIIAATHEDADRSHGAKQYQMPCAAVLPMRRILGWQALEWVHEVREWDQVRVSER